MIRLSHRLLVAASIAAVAAASLVGCSSSSSAPLAPVTTSSTPSSDASLKASVPAVQSPVNDAVMATLSSTTLVAAAAVPQYASITLQYRFQVFNDNDVLVVDSGPVAAPTYTVTTTLTPLTRYTWRVRAEYQGTAGLWSSTGSFKTPQQPPAYNRPIGNWQSCAGLSSSALVSCVWDAVRPTDAVSDMEVVKRVVWLLRGEGAGLLIKGSGDNVVLWAGYSFSASRLCFADGHVFKIIGDAGPGGANSPGFADNGFVDPKVCIPAIDPSTP